MSTVANALSTSWIERRSLLRLLILPWMLSVFGEACVHLGETDRPDTVPGLAMDIPYAASSVIALVTVALFGIAWHRRILLDEHCASWLRCHAWTPAHGPFFAWSLGLALLTVVPCATFVIHSGNQGVMILGTPVLLGVLYVVSRLSIALPATAVEAANDARSIWSLSNGAGIELVLVLVLAAIAASVLLIPIAILLEVAASAFPSSQYALLPFREAQAFLVTAIEISALSLSFKRLTGVRERLH